MAYLEYLGFLMIVWALVFYGAPVKFWTIVISALLAVFALFSSVHWFVLALSILVFAPIAVIANLSDIRQQSFTKPLFQLLKQLLPAIGETERIALEAGDVWWEGELFSGQPDWEKLIAMPSARLSKDEQSFLDNQVNTLCAMLDDWTILNEQHDLPKKVWTYLKKEKFFGLMIPKQYGGLEFSAYAHSLIISRIASRSVTAAVTAMVPNSLGPAELLLHYGTKEQKDYYLPRLASAKEIPCFALTGPEAGSDAASMPDKGKVCYGEYKGKTVLGIRLNWNKRYITLAPVTTLIGVAFKCYDPENLLGGEKNIGITLVLIPADHPGVQVGKRHQPLHTAFMNGPVKGEDVFVPIEWIIGGKERAGQGWKMLMESLSAGRGISLPSLSTAVTHVSYRTASAYAYVRRQFRVPIGRFEGVQEVLAHVGGFSYLCEAARQFTTSGIDQGVKPSLASAICKYHLTEMGRKALNGTMDIHGGRAIQGGPRNYLLGLYDAMPISITVEGANILTRNLIIFGQGAMRCHPYLQKEMDLLQQDEKDALDEFDNVLLSHVGFTVKNLVRAFGYGLTGGHLIRAPKQKSKLSRYYKQFTRMSAALALVSDFSLLILGGELKRKERLSARLGDVLSYLYLGSCVLHYFSKHDTPEDKLLADWAMKYCLYRINRAFDQFFANFPVRSLAVILKRVIFPFGKSYDMPKDALDHSVAKMMLEDNALRERLTSSSYCEEKEGDPVWRVEHAFKTSLEAKLAQAKLNKALREGRLSSELDRGARILGAVVRKIITQEEGEQLQQAEKLRYDALQVDEF